MIRICSILCAFFMLVSCAGTKEAIEVSKSLQTSSADASKAIRTVKEIQEINAQTLQKSLDTISDLSMQVDKNYIDQAIEKLHLSYFKIKEEINKDYSNAAANAHKEAWSFLSDINTPITKALSPLDDKIRGIEQEALIARKEAKLSPTADMKFKASQLINSALAATNYYNRSEFEAHVKARNGVQHIMVEHLSELSKLRNTHISELDKSYDATLGKLRKKLSDNSQKKYEFPIVSNFNKDLDILEDYTRSVREAGFQIETYLKINSISGIASTVATGAFEGFSNSVNTLLEGGAINTKGELAKMTTSFKALKDNALSNINPEVDVIIEEVSGMAESQKENILLKFRQKADELADNLLGDMNKVARKAAEKFVNDKEPQTSTGS